MKYGLVIVFFLVIVFTITFQGTVINQQSRLIRAMETNPACMVDK